MTTMTIPAASAENPLSGLSALWHEKRGKLIKVSVVVGLHVGLAAMLQSGMLHSAVQAVMPEPVMVTFVTPPPPPESKPQPKTVEVAKAPTVAPPPLPQLNIQVENTITLPPPAPRVAQEAPATPAAAPAAPPAPPAPPAPATPRTVQGVEYVRPPALVYPSVSKRLGETGVVMLRVLISEKGQAEQVQIHKSSGFTNLDEAGRQAAMRALFKPYVEDGKAVPVYVLVPINFQLS
ncbi:TonB family protein [Duganella sp. FT92W]|uniref:TonB family protein n=1 Tax=Pseudoduganella rivuli TaxID=2666085 RepID=A0A7X2ISR7_9BURK|nr:energy transducer TonB [Pseudoduganella rivuli]MRV75416.1 TonB family protein [Pseudoduganella rivuli]